MKCPACGAEAVAGANECASCGTSFTESEDDTDR